MTLRSRDETVTVDKNGSSNRFTPTILGTGSLVTNGFGEDDY